MVITIQLSDPLKSEKSDMGIWYSFHAEIPNFPGEQRIFTFRGDPLGGIFAAYYRATGQNPTDRRFVEVIPCDRACIHTHVLFSEVDHLYWHSHNDKRRWIIIRFPTCRVQLTGYAIQSASIGMPQSWTLEGTGDYVQIGDNTIWEPIDEVIRDHALADAGSIQYFDCIAERPFSVFRLTQIEQNLETPPTHWFAMKRLEFFGEIHI
jgi:hypothetical protein